MTIALGLVCENGLVLSADREMTHTTTKHRGTKAHILKGNDFEIGVVGAGSADLIIYAVQELERRLSSSMTVDAVRRTLESIASKIQRRHVNANPAAQHRLDLLVGVKTPQEIGLLNVAGTIVTFITSYRAIGFGGDLAFHILGHLYDENSRPTMAGGVILAAHVLRETKRSALYCGGESDLIVIQRGYQVAFVPENDIYTHEQTADRFMKIVRPVMLALTDINVEPNRLHALIGRMAEELSTVRTNEFIQQQRRRFDQILKVEPVLVSHLRVGDLAPTARIVDAASPLMTESPITSDVVAPPSPDSPLLFEEPRPSPAPPEDEDG
jgi:20S proteasome alpha/beta subunit